MNHLSTNPPPRHLYNYLPVYGWDKPMKQYGMTHVEFLSTVSFLPKPAGFEDLGLLVEQPDNQTLQSRPVP